MCNFQHQKMRLQKLSHLCYKQVNHLTATKRCWLMHGFLLNIYLRRAIFLRNLAYHQSFYKKLQRKETSRNRVCCVYLSQDELILNQTAFKRMSFSSVILFHA